MARKPPSDNSIRGGSMRVHCPGAYAHVLDKVCTQFADSVGDWLTASADPISLLEWEWRQAERKAAVMAERNGQPLKVQAYMLPRGARAQFGRCPSGGQHGMFVVTPDDEISFVPRQSERTA
jgi:hypothetical protein